MMDFAEVIIAQSAAFDRLCLERHEKGQEEYGVFTFMQNDVIRMMAEELADTANYCRMQFMKIMILQTMLEEKLAEEDPTGDNMGIGSFKGTGSVGWPS